MQTTNNAWQPCQQLSYLFCSFLACYRWMGKNKKNFNYLNPFTIGLSHLITPYNPQKVWKSIWQPSKSNNIHTFMFELKDLICHQIVSSMNIDQGRRQQKKHLSSFIATIQWRWWCRWCKCQTNIVFAPIMLHVKASPYSLRSDKRQSPHWQPSTILWSQNIHEIKSKKCQICANMLW